MRLPDRAARHRHSFTIEHTLALAVAAAAFTACGSGSPSSPSAQAPQLQTQTFTGTTRAIAAGSCTGDAHAFTAAEGPITVTLLQTSPPESLTVQVCPPSAGAQSPVSCAIARRQINVGETVQATRAGGADQVLSLLPLTCGTNAPPSAAPIAYTATVTYLK